MKKMVNAKQALRIEKANRILATVKSNSDKAQEVNEKILISNVCLEFGAGRRYIKEIIEDLIITGRITRTEKGLIYNEH